MDSAGLIDDAAIAMAGGRLSYVGPRAGLPTGWTAHSVRPLGGAWVLPGLIDCHTHLVYAGDRSNEAKLRAQDMRYEDIARAGGGIMATVRATRAADEDTLVRSAAIRARAMASEGVTTIEIKSGYGLDLETELKILRAAKRVGEAARIRVSRTFLGAHAIPPEFHNDRADYIRLICETMIPAAAPHADAVDVFCETIAFTPAETETIFAAAVAHGLKVKLHADQRSDGNGGALAAKHHALSADHLEHLNPDGIAAMAAAGTVAVLLPFAFHHLGDTHTPPVEGLRRAGVPIAIATDCNPGTSPTTSPLAVMALAREAFALTPEETLAGFTINAARALGLDRETGSLTIGKSADLSVWDIAAPADLKPGSRLLARYFRGRCDGDQP